MTRLTDRASYGFIRRLGAPGQVFFHQSQVAGGVPLDVGAEVTFCEAADEQSGRPTA